MIGTFPLDRAVNAAGGFSEIYDALERIQGEATKYLCLAYNGRKSRSSYITPRQFGLTIGGLRIRTVTDAISRYEERVAGQYRSGWKPWDRALFITAKSDSEGIEPESVLDWVEVAKDFVTTLKEYYKTLDPIAPIYIHIDQIQGDIILASGRARVVNRSVLSNSFNHQIASLQGLSLPLWNGSEYLRPVKDWRFIRPLISAFGSTIGIPRPPRLMSGEVLGLPPPTWDLIKAATESLADVSISDAEAMFGFGAATTGWGVHKHNKSNRSFFDFSLPKFGEPEPEWPSLSGQPKRSIFDLHLSNLDQSEPEKPKLPDSSDLLSFSKRFSWLDTSKLPGLGDLPSPDLSLPKPGQSEPEKPKPLHPADFLPIGKRFSWPDPSKPERSKFPSLADLQSFDLGLPKTGQSEPEKPGTPDPADPLQFRKRLSWLAQSEPEGSKLPGLLSSDLSFPKLGQSEPEKSDPDAQPDSLLPDFTGLRLTSVLGKDYDLGSKSGELIGDLLRIKKGNR